MFKEITSKITAEDVKNRILAYAAMQAAYETIDSDYWYGNISTYTLSLRLSGIYGEKQFNDVLSSGVDTTLNIGKYPYLENEVFLQETQHLDGLNFVKQLYQAFLAREADPGGLEGNVNQLKNGAPRANLVIGLRASGEADNIFLRVTECLDDAHFLEVAHRVYLKPENRQKRWLQDLELLEDGKSREFVFQDLKQFQQLQTALNDRQGDFYREDKVFLANTRSMSNEDFVKELYLTYCKREADPGGLAGNVEQLDNGVTRSDLLYELRTSEEAANVFVDLTAGLDNDSFIAVAYLAYRKEELTPQQQQKCLAILEAGNIRQTILREDLPAPTSQEVVPEPSQPSESAVVTKSPLEIATEQLQSSFALADERFLAQTENLSNQDFIQKLYLTYLRREADSEGLESSIRQLVGGLPRYEILYAIRTSEEAANVFVDFTANLDNPTFIELAYQYYRQQELDPQKQEEALKTLESGQIRQTILRDCPPPVVPILMDEGMSLPVVPSEPQYSSSLQQLLKDLEVDDPDFIARREELDDSEFVRQVYQIFFRREADTEGLTSHTEQLQQGVSRWEILYDLRTSEEAANVFVAETADLDNARFLDLAYEIYLKRELDPENRVAYLEYLDRGNPRQDILS